MNIRHIGPPGFAQPRKSQRRNELRRAARVARKFEELCCPFGLDDYDGARTWYETARADIRKTYGKDWRIAAALIAATSPQTDVRQNGKLARDAYNHWRAGTMEDWKPWLKAHENNVHRALAGAPLSGQKVENFRQALIGDRDAIVVDTWMLRAAGADVKAVKNGSPKWIRITYEAIRLAAEATGLRGCEAQAVIWTTYRANNWEAKRGAGTGALEV